MPVRRNEPLDIFAKAVITTAIAPAHPDECWPYGGTLTKPGYGLMSLAGVQVFAHRLSYTLLRGLIPEGLQLDHLCKNRRCINPNHLEPVTFVENVRRELAPASVNRRKTHCNDGHELSGDNLHVYRGKRYCRTCRRDRQRVRRQEQKCS